LNDLRSLKVCHSFTHRFTVNPGLSLQAAFLNPAISLELPPCPHSLPPDLFPRAPDFPPHFRDLMAEFGPRRPDLLPNLIVSAGIRPNLQARCEPRRNAQQRDQDKFHGNLLSEYYEETRNQFQKIQAATVTE
jgi:hypothetical protein